MRYRPYLFSTLFFAAVSLLRAQAAVPTVSQTVPTQSLVIGGPAVTVDLRNFITVPGVTGQIVQFDTVFGKFNVELRADVAPRHVTNFLGYVQRADYANTFIHRAASFEPGPVSIIQGGGYRFSAGNATEVPRQSSVPLEYNLANSRGTLAAARTTDINSATSEWFFNVRDNTTILNQGNGGGYTVFGRVLGTGMIVVDTIASLPRINAGGAFTELPARNFAGGTITADNLAIVNSVTAITLFPTGGGTSAVEYSIQNSAPSVVTAVLSGSTLTLTPFNGGTATITVRAVDTNGNTTQTTFGIEVAAVQPVFLGQPASQTVAAGSTVVFQASASAAPAYQWKKRNSDGNLVEIFGATTSTLVIRNVSGPDAGTYVNTAVNSIGLVTSEPATLTVADIAEANVGRLGNLSVLTSAGAGSRVLTVGAVIGPLNSTLSLPVVIRAVGPTLAQAPFNVPGVLADPILTFNAGATAIASNDDWGGGADLANAFAEVGAFALPAGSRDAAIVRAAPGLAVGNYTVQVSGKADATGLVLAEMYDAAAGARTANTPRLINLSVLKQLDTGEMMTAGFVIQGQSARTVLVRAIGPALVAFNVADPMPDPTLALFSGQTKIAENDNWAGDLHLTSLGNGVGAFPVFNAFSRDAMLVMTLAPGNYTAQVSGVSGVGGNVIVEVYEVR
ncbi:MAG: peptidylprolyl isomerase [Opitutaceae bacterium]|nr:peptidylprolyl isomerase [Opitutaceae bacterium]